MPRGRGFCYGDVGGAAKTARCNSGAGGVMEQSLSWVNRALLLALCAGWMQGGFIALSDPGTLAELAGGQLHIAKAGPAAGLMVINALAATVMVLFEGKARRLAALWLGLVSILGALMVHRFWGLHGAEFTLSLQGFLGMVGFGAAVLMVARSGGEASRRHEGLPEAAQDRTPGRPRVIAPVGDRA